MLLENKHIQYGDYSKATLTHRGWVTRWVSLTNQQNLCLGKNTSFIGHELLTWLKNSWSCYCSICAIETFIMTDKILLAVYLSPANVAVCVNRCSLSVCTSMFLLVVGCPLFLGVKKKTSHLLVWCHLPCFPIMITFALTFAKVGLGMGISVGRFFLRRHDWSQYLNEFLLTKIHFYFEHKWFPWLFSGFCCIKWTFCYCY